MHVRIQILITIIMKQVVVTLLLALCCANVEAQINMPQPSPSSMVTQNVGLAEVKVEYSRPSAKGRKIFGEVVPFGDLWRTGANGATKFTTNDSLTIMGAGLPKGTYVLTTRPGRDEWEIIFNKNLSSSASNLKPEGEVLKVKVKPQTLPFKMETFTILIGNITSNGASLDIVWEDTYVSVPFTNDFETKVAAQIKAKLDGPTQDEYFSMSQYYFEKSRNLADALTYVNKAVEKGERFWMLRHKSLVQAKLGDLKGATETAQRSLALAKEAKNNDYIRMNEKSIEEWAKK
jgi:hypothetical protein